MNCGFFEGMRWILREEGVGGIYKGVTATVAKQASNQGLRFMFMGSFKDYVSEGGKKKIHPVTTVIGGMGAGLFSVLGNNVRTRPI